MTTYRLTDPAFGDTTTTYEAESPEAIADEMMPQLRIWAAENGRSVEDLREDLIDSLESVE